MYKLIELIQSDKATHILLCYFITIILPWYFAGAVLAFGLGLFKKYKDYTTPGHVASWWDMLANVVGITIGVLTIIYL